jgi:hypothetical protein
MAKGKLFLWVYEVLLVIGFVRGLFMFGEPDVPRVALCIGFAINVLLQYNVIKAIRRKPLEELPPNEQAIAKTRQKAVMKTVLTGAAALAIVMLVNVGLFIKHVYSARAFAFVQLAAMLLFFSYFIVSFKLLQKKTGIGISNGS